MRAKRATVLLAAVTLSVSADEPPPAEFWLYLLDYGNDQAEVLDPLEFEQLASSSEQKAPAADASAAGQEEENP